MAGGRLFAGVGLILIGCAPTAAPGRGTVLVPPVYLSQRPPAYPSMLQSQGVEGVVAYAVRVMPDGRADVSTFRVDTASHPLFAVAVKNAVPHARWAHAQAAWRPGTKRKSTDRGHAGQNGPPLW